MNMDKMKIWKRRDLTLVSGLDAKTLVISCDSCGAVGQKEGDVLKLSPYYAGKMTARVALTEVLCAGAVPIIVSDGIACEMNPAGREIIRGIQAELEEAGLSEVVLTGSTEENFPACMTALGLTVIAVSDELALKIDTACTGDCVLLFGKPAAGAEVNLNGGAFYEEIRFLLSQPEVREIVPVGSKGIACEAEGLAHLNEKLFTAYETNIDLSRSAGPATCMIALCSAAAYEKIKTVYPALILIGELK